MPRAVAGSLRSHPPIPRPAPLLALLLALLATALAGCHTPIDGGRGLPPLFERSPLPPEGSENHEWHLWPLLGHIETPERSRTGFLWPLVRDDLTPGYRRTVALPIYHRVRYTHVDGQVDTQTIFLPTFYGRDAVDGSYFSIFPLGGTAKGILGLDRIDYALFPLWVRTRDRDRVSNHLLWPIFQWSSGTRQSGGRFFPFYARYRGYNPEGVLRYDRRSYLWPFVSLQENDLDTDSPSTVRWFWPFWGSIRGDRLRRTTIAWPLLGRDVYPRRERSSWYLFPLLRFSWERGELVQYDIYPLFGHREAGGTVRDFFLWPLFGRERTVEGEYLRDDRWFFPFYRRTVTRTHDHPEGDHLQRLWPLFRYRRDIDGVRTWSAIDPIPYVDFDGLEWFYSRVWRVYRQVDDPGRDRRAWELLWGVATGSRDTSGTRFSILGGLFGRERRRGADGESDTRWRLLYIPF